MQIWNLLKVLKVTNFVMLSGSTTGAVPVEKLMQPRMIVKKYVSEFPNLRSEGRRLGPNLQVV